MCAECTDPEPEGLLEEDGCTDPEPEELLEEDGCTDPEAGGTPNKLPNRPDEAA